MKNPPRILSSWRIQRIDNQIFIKKRRTGIHYLFVFFYAFQTVFFTVLAVVVRGVLVAFWAVVTAFILPEY